MAHKKVSNSDAGTADIFGGNDLDKWSDFASGIDVDDYDINSDFTVRSGKRKLRNPANTFSYIETTSAIAADRTILEPALLTNDTRVYESHLQQINSKTAGNWLKFTKQTTAPANQALADDIMIYNKQVDASNNGLFFKYKEGGAIVEARIGSGGGFSAGGSINKSGDGISTTVNIAHGLSTTPDVYFAFPLNAAARGSITYSVTSTNIVLSYPIAPAEGVNNLSYVWAAGYVSPAVVELSAASTTTFTNKTIGDYLDFTRITIPSNPGTNVGRLYHKQIDTNNDGLFVKLKKAGAIVEVQIA